MVWSCRANVLWENDYETFWADAGFVRSWKLNLRLTTRAYDSHATPYLSLVHLVVLSDAGHAKNAAERDD